MRDEITKLASLLHGVRNPVPAMLDRFGMRASPYELRHRAGYRVELRPRTGDLFGFYEILLRGDYTSGGQHISPGATVIDVGANIGCFTILASTAVGATGRVIAVEPDAATFSQLLKNIRANALGNVMPVQAAIGGRDGVTVLHSDHQALFSSLYASVNGRPVRGRDHEVRMLTLNSLMRECGVEHCEYLKLDCEGAEHDIVANLSPGDAARISQITLEIHKVPGFDGAKLAASLTQLGYECVPRGKLAYYRRKGRVSGSQPQ